MGVDGMQWGAEPWQFADLHMPDDPSPFQNGAGVPCVMLIHGGFAEVSGDAVVILSRSAEKVSDVDVERAQQAAKRAQERLSSKDSAIDVSRAGSALRRALLRERLGKRSS